MKKTPLSVIGFVQALGLVMYTALIAFIFTHTEEWFQGAEPEYFGIIFMLSLLIASVLISALIALGVPITLIWKDQKVREGIALIGYTAVWLIVFLIILAISFSAL